MTMLRELIETCENRKLQNFHRYMEAVNGGYCSSTIIREYVEEEKICDRLINVYKSILRGSE